MASFADTSEENTSKKLARVISNIDNSIKNILIFTTKGYNEEEKRQENAKVNTKETTYVPPSTPSHKFVKKESNLGASD